MRVRDLKAALAALPPEYDDSMIITNTPGMGGPCEATRLITIPMLTEVSGRYSYEEFDRVVWIDSGGELVAASAAAEGWRVPYCNQVPTPATRKALP